MATWRDARGRLITHRVVSVAPAGGDAPAGTVSVQMKGDANDATDPRPYIASRALVRCVTVPGVGPVVATVQRPSVAVPALVALAALIAIAFVPTGRRETTEPGSLEHTDAPGGGTLPDR